MTIPTARMFFQAAEAIGSVDPKEVSAHTGWSLAQTRALKHGIVADQHHKFMRLKSRIKHKRR